MVGSTRGADPDSIVLGQGGSEHPSVLSHKFVD